MPVDLYLQRASICLSMMASAIVIYNYLVGPDKTRLRAYFDDLMRKVAPVLHGMAAAFISGAATILVLPLTDSAFNWDTGFPRLLKVAGFFGITCAAWYYKKSPLTKALNLPDVAGIPVPSGILIPGASTLVEQPDKPPVDTPKGV